MRTDSHRLFRTLVLGVFSLAVGATCLFVAFSEGPTASSAILLTQRSGSDTPTLDVLASDAGSALMSCADEGGPSGEPMWCSNPASPHCSPALPKPTAPDAVQGPVATLVTSLVAPATIGIVVRRAWPTPRPEHTRSLQLRHRLERPPRV